MTNAMRTEYLTAARRLRVLAVRRPDCAGFKKLAIALEERATAGVGSARVVH